MTRSELVERLAQRMGQLTLRDAYQNMGLNLRKAQRMGQLTLRDAEQAVKTIFDAMALALAKGHRIEIRGFGSFSVNHRRPRVGRNPRSGEAVAVPEKRVAHFKPGKILRAAVEVIPQRVDVVLAKAENDD